MSERHDHVGLQSGQKPRPDGGPSLEHLAAHKLSDNRYRLLDSPWTFYGLASGDVVEVDPEGAWTLVERGNRVAIQMWSRTTTPEIAKRIGEHAEAQGGTWDNMSRNAGAIVISFPVTVGHGFVVATMQAVQSLHSDLEWNYSNVYDGDVPLEWAREFLTR